MKKIPTTNHYTARDIVLACCVLHNFCILSKDKSTVEEDGPGGDDDDGENNDSDIRRNDVLDRDAAEKRESVMRLMGLGN